MVNYRERLEIDFDLSPKQIEILERDKDTLVRALPGSGKTTILTLKIKTLLLDNLHINKCCCISYTNVNVDDLRESCSKILNRESFDKVDFLTFHSFCMQYVLSPFSYLYRSKKGLRPYKKIFNYEEHGRLLIDYLRKEKIEEDDIEKILKNEKIYYNLKFIDGKWDPISDSCKPKTISKYLNFLNARKLIDFNLINLLSLFIIQENPNVQRALNKAIDWFFIDEFQDISEIQCKIIEVLRASKGRDGTNTKWFMVGDPNQSIYGFAGANPRSMYDMKSFFNNLNNGENCEIKLEKSHRCSDLVFDFAKNNYNSVIDQIKNSNAIQSLGNPQILGYLNDLEISDDLRGNGDIGQVIIKTTASTVSDIIDIKFNELFDQEVCCIGITKFNSFDVYKQYRLHDSFDTGEGFTLYADLFKEFENKYGFKDFSLFVNYLILKHHFYTNRVKYSKSLNRFIYFLKLLIFEKVNIEPTSCILETIAMDSIDIVSPLKVSDSIISEFSGFNQRLTRSINKNLNLTESERSVFSIVPETDKRNSLKNEPEPLISDFISFITRSNTDKLAFEIKHIHKIKGLEYEHVILQKVEDLPHRHWENNFHKSLIDGNQYNPNVDEIYNYIQDLNKLYVMLTRPRKNLYIIRDVTKLAYFLH